MQFMSLSFFLSLIIALCVQMCECPEFILNHTSYFASFVSIASIAAYPFGCMHAFNLQSLLYLLAEKSSILYPVSIHPISPSIT